MIRSTLVALVLAAVASPALAQSQPAIVITQGEAVIKHAPDRAWITVSTETRDPKAADARRKNAEFMTAVQKSLGGAGVVAEAIRTTAYSLMPDMEYTAGRGVMRGYIVRNQIEVRVDDLDKLGEVLDAANGAKGSTISITGPRFDLKNRDAVQNDALRQAVESAMSRAQAMAAGARRSLGAIVRIEEENGPSFPTPMPAMRLTGVTASVDTPITPGEIEIHAQVAVTVEIH